MSKGIDHGIDTGIVAQEPCGKSPSCHMEALAVDLLSLREDRVEGLIADFRCQCAIGRTVTDKYIRTGCLGSAVPNVSVQRVS